MNCVDCNKTQIYNVNCLICCVRLVKSARPDRKKQEAMIEHIKRHRTFLREQIIEAIKADATIS